MAFWNPSVRFSKGPEELSGLKGILFIPFPQIAGSFS